MIKYRLICKNCELSFDSWFSSSEEYEKIKKRKFLDCHSCKSNKIEKTLMAPKLIGKTEINKNQLKTKNFREINKKIKDYQKFIKRNFEYVGDNFAYEARSIHYNSNKKQKGIYGSASKKELKELKEEGIEAQVIPWVEDKSN